MTDLRFFFGCMGGAWETITGDARMWWGTRERNASPDHGNSEVYFKFPASINVECLWSLLLIPYSVNLSLHDTWYIVLICWLFYHLWYLVRLEIIDKCVVVFILFGMYVSEIVDIFVQFEKP